MEYNAIISIGTFCQVGGALWVYGLKNINSPLDNFGIKRWTSVAEILETRFKDYWRLENMAPGKTVLEISSSHNGEKKMMTKVYCNKYDLVSNHNFLEEENPNGELRTYPEFREKLTFLQDVFLKQCEEYENIRFVMKAMSWPNPHDTVVDSEDVLHLLKVLSDLRGGKPFDLALSVPRKQYEKVKTWASEAGIDNLLVSAWDIDFNNDKHEEWEAMFEGAELDEDYYWRLVSEIIGDTEIDLVKVNNF